MTFYYRLLFTTGLATRIASVTIPLCTSVGMTLNSAFEVRGIPFMIVISETGEVISREGRQEVMSMGAGAFQTWDESHSDVDTSVVEVLKDNAPEVTREAGEILVKLMSNVIRDPQNMKYRQIRLANPKIESKLLSANGAFEILFSGTKTNLCTQSNRCRIEIKY